MKGESKGGELELDLLPWQIQVSESSQGAFPGKLWFHTPAAQFEFRFRSYIAAH